MIVLAYIDPGTGSIILQALIGGFFASLVTIGFYWGKVKRIFTRRSAPSDADDQSQS